MLSPLRAITLEREPSKKKQRTDTKKDAKRIKRIENSKFESKIYIITSILKGLKTEPQAIFGATAVPASLLNPVDKPSPVNLHDEN